MDAVEFIKQKNRMCDRYYSNDCKGCPLQPAPEDGGYASCDQFVEEDPEEVVLNVEEWAKENPIVTNAMKFEEIFGTLKPVAKLINSNPVWWDKEYEKPCKLE